MEDVIQYGNFVENDFDELPMGEILSIIGDNIDQTMNSVDKSIFDADKLELKVHHYKPFERVRDDALVPNDVYTYGWVATFKRSETV